MPTPPLTHSHSLRHHHSFKLIPTFKLTSTFKSPPQVSYRLERVPTPATLEAGEGASRVTAALTAALTQDSLTLTRPNRFGNALNSLGMTNTVRGSLASDLLLAEIRRAAEAGFRPDETRRVSGVGDSEVIDC